MLPDHPKSISLWSLRNKCDKHVATQSKKAKTNPHIREAALGRLHKGGRAPSAHARLCGFPYWVWCSCIWAIWAHAFHMCLRMFPICLHFNFQIKRLHANILRGCSKTSFIIKKNIRAANKIQGSCAFIHFSHYIFAILLVQCYHG